MLLFGSLDTTEGHFLSLFSGPIAENLRLGNYEEQRWIPSNSGRLENPGAWHSPLLKVSVLCDNSRGREREGGEKRKVE